MPERADRAAVAAAATLLLFAAAAPFSIAIAQIALSLLAIIWVVRGAPLRPRALVWPAALYCALTLLSALASADPWMSLVDTRELLQLLLLVVVPAVGATARARAPLVLAAAAGVSGAWGIIEYAHTSGGLHNRADGPFGHYMTFAGVLMLVATAAMAYALTPGLRGRWVMAAALPPLAGGLLVSYARNAWLGVAAGLLVVAALKRPRALPALLALGTVALLLSPPAIRARVWSAFDPDANRDRLEMLQRGRAIIREHPLLGVGSAQVPEVLKRLDTTGRRPPHLHNNPVQIAAERGLVAAAAWLWLLAAAATLAWRKHRRYPHNADGAAACGAIAALLVAGLFEYNFGDSEVKMTFLLLVALAAPPADEAPAAAGSSVPDKAPPEPKAPEPKAPEPKAPEPEAPEPATTHP